MSTRMTIASTSEKRGDLPDRILLYGPEGIGKTEWAFLKTVEPVILSAEDGINHLYNEDLYDREPKAFPEPKNFTEVLEAISSLITDEHDYKTLVVDTLDWIEPLIWAEVVRDQKKPKEIKCIDDIGFFRGYGMALEYWRRFLNGINRCRKERGMEIILLAHSQVKSFQNPLGNDYDRYIPMLDKKAAGLVKQWVDTILFANYEEYGVKDEGAGMGARAKAGGSGRRVVYTEHAPGWDAKNRHGLPPSLSLDYAEYAEARAAGEPADADDLYAEAMALVAQLPEKTPAKKVKLIAEDVKASKKNANRLAKIVDRLRTLASQEGAE